MVFLRIPSQSPKNSICSCWPEPGVPPMRRFQASTSSNGFVYNRDWQSWLWAKRTAYKSCFLELTALRYAQSRKNLGWNARPKQMILIALICCFIMSCAKLLGTKTSILRSLGLRRKQCYIFCVHLQQLESIIILQVTFLVPSYFEKASHCWLISIVWRSRN